MSLENTVHMYFVCEEIWRVLWLRALGNHMMAPLLGGIGGNNLIEIKLWHIENDHSFADCLLDASL